MSHPIRCHLKQLFPAKRLVMKIRVVAALALAVCTGGLLPGCAVDTASVVPAVLPERKLDARQVFSDPRVAELARAAAAGDIARVRALAPAIDLATRGDKDITLLQWAVFNRGHAGLGALLDAGADPTQPGIDGDTVVHLASQVNDARYLQLLLAKGANPNVPNGITRATPLHSAIRGSREAQYRALLAAGADHKLADRTGNTALHLAAQTNQPAFVLDLLNRGTDPHARNAQKVTFQNYLFMTRRSLLTAEARANRDAVRAWLSARGIALESEAP